MSYAHIPYPALRYGANGATRIVANTDEDAAAASEGFREHQTLAGKPLEAAKPKAAAPAPAAVTPKAEKPAKAEKAPKAEKPAKATETPLEKAIEKAVENNPPSFDRAVAIATLEAANFDVDPDTTDEELVEALAELAK